jgi:hypothetical protein
MGTQNCRQAAAATARTMQRTSTTGQPMPDLTSCFGPVWDRRIHKPLLQISKVSASLVIKPDNHVTL